MSPATFVCARILEEIAKGQELSFGLPGSMNDHGPSEPKDSQPCELKLGRTFAVIFESLRGVVEAPTVQFDDQPPLLPVGVDQEAADNHVDLRRGKVQTVHHAEKFDFEYRSRVSRQRVKFVDQTPQSLNASPSGPFGDTATQMGKVESAGQFSFIQDD
jgi:hypothetical protein